MDAIKFLKEKNRMTKKCSIRCANCKEKTEKERIQSENQQ